MSSGAAEDPVPMAASPVSTGGGGVVLEHRYGAVLLARLLNGDPVPNLGDDAVPVEISLQASAFSPVDDIVVVGRLPDGQQRRLSIGVRRDPSVVASEVSTVKLMGSYLRIVHEHWSEVESGLWRLGLAVASPNVPAQQVACLAEIARAVPDEGAFRAAVARPGRTTTRVRDRLEQVDRIVTAAAADLQLDASAEPVGRLTWRLLANLWPVEIHLEGADQADRSDTVGRLRSVTRSGTLDAADKLFSRIAELVTGYAPAAAKMTGAMLRRDLVGTPLVRSSTCQQGWAVLDGLAQRLRDHTGPALTGPEGDLEVDRIQARCSLRRALTEIRIDHGVPVNHGGVMVVRGEPDVGKSALTLRVVEELQRDGAGVTAISLRDLPDTTLALESVLGAGLTEVLGGTAVHEVRLLVIDGAEAVLEGRGALLTDLATAALRAGLGVVAVARSDAATAVAEHLVRASRAVHQTGVAPQPVVHDVPALDTAETRRVAATFPALARLAGDPRSAWVLARPGLVELLLRDGATRALPTGPVSEADVFAAIWTGLVRGGETTPVGGPTPDAREHALVGLARRTLFPGAPWESAALSALPALRSDGLLRPASAWGSGEEFGSDLVRDLAVARLLLTDGWPLITEAGAPRWTMRAVRLACQARLAHAGSSVAVELAEQRPVFGGIAEVHGARWAELPWEALLTLGPAGEALTAVWPVLIADERQGLAVLLRLALTRYCRLGVGDPVVLAPLVELAYCRDDVPEARHRYPRDLGKQIQQLVLAWLRGLVQAGARPTAVRASVRDTVLATSPTRRDEFAVELMGLLGPDLNTPAESLLRGLAAEGGGYLAPAVESVYAAIAMANTNVNLLLVLTEAYYLESPPADQRPPRLGSARWGGEEGIRPHHGVVTPLAAWWRGPFFTLLRAQPVLAIGLIQRLLNHAAQKWVDRLGRYIDTELGDVPSGIELELPGGSRQWCIGDANVWRWYRGSGSGVSPCVSALLAVERYSDHLVDDLGVPVDQVVSWLLRGCENLAMPALALGLQVRHLESAGPDVDLWLAQPPVWELEFGRRATEGLLHVQGPDDSDLHGRHRRAYTLREVAGELVADALIRDDQDRLAALRDIGGELLRRARQLAGTDNEDDDLAAVAGWASSLDASNYRLYEGPTGTGVLYEPPAQVRDAQAVVTADLARGQQATRLVMTYGKREDRAGPCDTITEDLALAYTLATDPPGSGLSAPDAVAAVAATALVGQVHQQVTLGPDDIRWAADFLLTAARLPRSGGLAHSIMIDPMGADRSAAIGLPTLLLPACAEANVDRARIEHGLIGCATSDFNEVRRALAVGLAPVWAAPCDSDATTGPCRHRAGWNAVEAGLCDCRLGDWDPSGRGRVVAPLTGPLLEELPRVETDRLLVDRLTGPLVACADAARSDSCISDDAVQLLDVLLAAHRRGALHWSVQGYGPDDDEDHRRVVGILLSTAACGDWAPLIGHVQAYANTPRALAKLLHDAGQLYTYRSDLRRTLATTWPVIMQTALDAITNVDTSHSDWDDVLAHLIPDLSLAISDPDPDTTLATARADWIHPDMLHSLIERWILVARGGPDAVDTLVGLARTAPTSWQTTTGLRWTDRLIGGDYDAIALRSWRLPGWLADLRSASHLSPGDAKVLHRVLDGLAAAGDRRAAAVQLAAE
jgi:hypothetical protein